MATTICEEICQYGFEGDPWNQNDKDAVERFLRALFIERRTSLDARSKCLLWRAALAFKNDSILTAYKLIFDLCDCPGSATGKGSSTPLEKANDSALEELNAEDLEFWLDYCTGEFRKVQR